MYYHTCCVLFYHSQQSCMESYLQTCKLKRRTSGVVQSKVRTPVQATKEMHEGEEEEDVIIMASAAATPRYKLLQFHTNYRPAYFGSWRKKSSVITPRNPFRKDEVRKRQSRPKGDWSVIIIALRTGMDTINIVNSHYWEFLFSLPICLTPVN